MKKIYLNTIIALADGLTQGEFIDCLLAQAIDIAGIEYRYEMFSKEADKRQREILSFLETGKLKNWDHLLSVPDHLFTSEGLSPKLESYLQVASQLGAHRIKLTVGDLDGIPKTSKQVLDQLVEQYQVAINIENDQTKENGSYQVIAEALARINEIGLPISYTFDAGNYAVVKEDAAQAFEQLNAATSIFHVKNIDQAGQATLLNDGVMVWQDYLGLDIPYVLEYPMAMSELENELTIFKEAFY